ncbi:hypothetical protein [Photobacterium satsumensis]|uniref:hypothetical protein n=1 Tax=Photobacterium satsumensis TaxID=2910239 RepID=UPI003D0FD35A
MYSERILAPNKNLKLSLFKTVDDKVSGHKASFEWLAQKAANPYSTDKNETPVFICTGTKSKQKKDIIAHDKMNCLVLDIDSHHYEEDEIASLMAGFDCDYVCYATASSMKSKAAGVAPMKRWRIILRLPLPVCADAWVKMQKGLIRTVPGSDRAMASVCQVSFLPTVNDSTVHYWHKFELSKGGLSRDHIIRLTLEGIEYEKEEAATSRLANPSGAFRADVSWSDTVDPAQSVSPIAAYNHHTSIHALLADYGFKRHGTKYIHPNSQSGKAGIIVFNNGTGYYSHHSEDPLFGGENGKAFDAFSVYKWLEHEGDHNAALIAAGDMFIVTSSKTGHNRTVTEHNQTAFKIQQRLAGNGGAE